MIKHHKIGREPVEKRTCALCHKRIDNEMMGMREHLLWEHEKEELIKELQISEYDYKMLLQGFTITPGYN